MRTDGFIIKSMWARAVAGIELNMLNGVCSVKEMGTEMSGRIGMSRGPAVV